MALTKEEKQNIVNEFGIRGDDTGSSQVQVAMLTKNITKLTTHCQKNTKDYSTRRGLLQMVSDRKSLLQYIQRQDVGQYKELIAKLGLRK